MTIEKNIKEIIADAVDCDQKNISLSQKLSELGADSLTAIEIIVAIEKTFNVEVPQDFDPNSTVEELIAFVKENS